MKHTEKIKLLNRMRAELETIEYINQHGEIELNFLNNLIILSGEDADVFKSILQRKIKSDYVLIPNIIEEMS